MARVCSLGGLKPCSDTSLPFGALCEYDERNMGFRGFSGYGAKGRAGTGAYIDKCSVGGLVNPDGSDNFDAMPLSRRSVIHLSPRVSKATVSKSFPYGDIQRILKDNKATNLQAVFRDEYASDDPTALDLPTRQAVVNEFFCKEVVARAFVEHASDADPSGNKKHHQFDCEPADLTVATGGDNELKYYLSRRYAVGSAFEPVMGYGTLATAMTTGNGGVPSIPLCDKPGLEDGKLCIGRRATENATIQNKGWVLQNDYHELNYTYLTFKNMPVRISSAEIAENDLMENTLLVDKDRMADLTGFLDSDDGIYAGRGNRKFGTFREFKESWSATSGTKPGDEAAVAFFCNNYVLEQLREHGLVSSNNAFTEGRGWNEDCLKGMTNQKCACDVQNTEVTLLGKCRVVPRPAGCPKQ